MIELERGAELVQATVPAFLMSLLLFHRGEAFMAKHDFRRRAEVAKLHRHHRFDGVRRLFPLPRVHEPFRRLDLLVDARYAVFGAIRASHHNAITSADLEIDFRGRDLHGPRRAPFLQLFRPRPRAEDAVPRRAECAADFEDPQP